MTAMIQDSDGNVTPLLNVECIVFNGLGDPIVTIGGEKHYFPRQKILVVTE